MTPAVTVYSSVNGAPVNKLVKRLPDGSTHKGMVPHEQHYWVEHRAAANPEAMGALLREIGDRPDALFSTSLFNDPPVPRWQTLSCAQLMQRTGCERDGLSRWHSLGGTLVTARIADSMGHGPWLGVEFDADDDAPPGWESWSFEDRCAATDLLIPGFATCGKVVTRSTTTRVTVDGVPLASSGRHVFVLTTDPGLIDVKWRQAQWRALLTSYQASPWEDDAPLAFRKYRRSRAGDREIVGVDWRTVYDRATGHVNRLWFDGAPTVQGDGLEVLPADVEVFDGPPLDLSRIADLTKDEWRRACDVVQKMKGVRPRVSVSRSGTRGRHSPAVSVSITVRDWDRDSVIDTEDGATTYDAWKRSGEVHTRCQSPFRESTSMAAFIGRHSNGEPFIYDSGTGEKHMLWLDDRPSIEEKLEDWQQEKYDPSKRDAFERAYYSRTKHCWIKLSDIKIPSHLFDDLATACDAPLDPDGFVKMNALKLMARQLLPHAFAELIEPLPVDESSEIGDLIGALLRHLVTYDGVEGLGWYKRQLGAWAYYLATTCPGRWVRLHGYEIMGRVEDQSGAGFRVAIRHALARQLSSTTHSLITDMSPTMLTQACGRTGIRDDSVHSSRGGDRWLHLTHEYVADLDLNYDPTLKQDEAAVRLFEAVRARRRPDEEG